MKTERRHELQTNVLADWLGKRIEIVRPYSKVIVGAVVGLVAVGGIGAYIANSQGSYSAEAWQEYFSAAAKSDPEVLIKVGDRYDSTEAGLWAFQSAADIRFLQGSQQLFRDLETAKDDLNEARDNYQRVIDDASPGTMLFARAHFGLAQTLESLGEVQEAKKHYKTVADGPTAIAESAAERLAELENPKVKNWYNWFADAKRPALTGNPLDNQGRPDLPGSLPGLNDPLSDRPDFLNNLPNTEDPLGLGDTRSAPETSTPDSNKNAAGSNNSFDPNNSTPPESKPLPDPATTGTGTTPPGEATPPAGTDPPKTGTDPPKTGTDPPKTGTDPPKTGTDPPKTDPPKTDPDPPKSATGDAGKSGDSTTNGTGPDQI